MSQRYFVIDNICCPKRVATVQNFQATKENVIIVRDQELHGDRCAPCR